VDTNLLQIIDEKPVGCKKKFHQCVGIYFGQPLFKVRAFRLFRWQKPCVEVLKHRYKHLWPGALDLDRLGLGCGWCGQIVFIREGNNKNARTLFTFCKGRVENVLEIV